MSTKASDNFNFNRNHGPDRKEVLSIRSTVRTNNFFQKVLQIKLL